MNKLVDLIENGRSYLSLPGEVTLFVEENELFNNLLPPAEIEWEAIAPFAVNNMELVHPLDEIFNIDSAGNFNDRYMGPKKNKSTLSNDDIEIPGSVISEQQKNEVIEDAGPIYIRNIIQRLDQIKDVACTNENSGSLYPEPGIDNFITQHQNEGYSVSDLLYGNIFPATGGAVTDKGKLSLDKNEVIPPVILGNEYQSINKEILLYKTEDKKEVIRNIFTAYNGHGLFPYNVASSGDGQKENIPFLSFSKGNDTPVSLEGKRELGGPVRSGKNYLIGEKGPEILMMGNEGGTVLSNSDITAEKNDALELTDSKFLESGNSEDLMTSVRDILNNLCETEFRAAAGIIKDEDDEN